MHISYKFAGFKEIEKVGELVVMENDLTRIQPCPEYMKVEIIA
jgi:citrate lyase synthetase